MVLVEPVMDGEDVGLVGTVCVDAPGFNVVAEVHFEFHVSLWTLGRHGCFMAELKQGVCTCVRLMTALF